jgi:hypothetical protein
MLSVAFLLWLAPFAIAWTGGSLDRLFTNGQWRGLLVSPTVIMYILAIAPRLARMETGVVNSLRPLVLVENHSFERIIREAAYMSPRNELIAIGSGALVGLLSVIGSSGASISLLTAYWVLSTVLMYGLLAWTIYVSLASTRLTASILRQPLRVDPFDVAPFEAIGRQSLLLALVFIGGITLSLLFIIFQPEILRRMEFWLIYIPLALVPVIVFFLNMQPTHRVLAAAKERELKAVQRHIQRTCRNLVQRLDESQESGSLAAEINALVAYEEHLQGARTWPYNTAMLRTLFFSVLIPGGTMLGRWVMDKLFG